MIELYLNLRLLITHLLNPNVQGQNFFNFANYFWMFLSRNLNFVNKRLFFTTIYRITRYWFIRLFKTIKRIFISSVAQNSYVYSFLCVSKSKFHVSLLHVHVWCTYHARAIHMFLQKAQEKRCNDASNKIIKLTVRTYVLHYNIRHFVNLIFNYIPIDRKKKEIKHLSIQTHRKAKKYFKDI